jgi:murein DD-endopeptidase MepM/ murein hydrolase activator NlpD
MPMPSPIRPYHRRAGAALTIVALAIAIVWLSSGPPPARAAGTAGLKQKISSGQNRVSSLSGAVGAASKRVAGLNSSISALEGQISRIQSNLDADRAQLLKLRTELDSARIRLAQLQAAERRTQAVLSQQLIGSYESDRPDIVTVVLESTGFSNLLERLAFASRISHQDAQIVGRVRSARRAVAAQATRLGTLSERQQRLTQQVLDQRNRLGRDKVALVTQQIAATGARNGAAGKLASARGQVASLRHQLASLEAAQARQAAAAAQNSSGSSGSSGGSSGPTSGPVSAPSSGGFTFPMPKGDASPPGTWSLDDGVDISAPGGTPEVAVCSGTVVLHGIGGFGPSAPVVHCDSPLAGYDYVYYGHAGPGNWVPVGTHVSQGQVISQVGYGIVGISTGPHLELGFADSSGSPVGPSSAPAMMSLLQSAYAG